MDTFERIEPEDVFRAMDRLDFEGRPDRTPIKGPHPERSVSGRNAPSCGPFFLDEEDSSVRELGLLLDPDLVDELMLADEPTAPLPVEALAYRVKAPVEEATLPPFLAERPAKRAAAGSPILRGMASFALPGWGQRLNGELHKARAFRTVALVTLLAADLLILREPIEGALASTPMALPSDFARALTAVALAGWMVWLLSAYDALVVASALRRVAR